MNDARMDIAFWLVAMVTPVVVLFVLWLQNSGTDESVTVGNVIAPIALGLVLATLLRRRRR